MLEKTESIFESKHWRVILAKDQTYLGRAYVVAKNPRASLTDLTSEEWEDLRANVIVRYEAAVTKAFGATLFNWSCLMNLAYKNNPPDPQVHWHVKPRYRVGAVVAGARFDDTNFGEHYAFPTERIVSDVVMQEIADRIKKQLL